ncbi:uncharacterized protein LOC133731021 [Rosa rugosa]|uniref:uncharacterized protein LOC133731021 n=1 Tax=Rosa rugosa TaxID=74645 RepID=UPI002B4039C1|nr:uncharacterized protein LOC133731021 [Rosa rugosa]
MIFLIEIRQSDETISKRQSDLKYADSFAVSPVGNSGGLALLWKNTVSVVVLPSNKNFIDSVVSFVAEGFQCKITWMYGNPHTNEKSSFWYSMFRRFSPVSTPWLCLGDFNDILNAFEKWGGATRLQWRMNLFRNFLTHTELRDLNFQGPIHTWYCMRQSQIFIKERLDRSLGNVHWCAAQPNSQNFNLPKLGSDHRPILLDTNPLETRGPPVFRFEHTWTTHVECFGTIQENWHDTNNRSPMNQWSKNLHSCKKALKKWSKVAFPNSKDEVAGLTRQLEALLTDATPNAGHQIQMLTSQIHHLWGLEEMFWHQRSRVQWLNLGDHGPRDWDDVLNLVDPIISPEMNASLLAPVSVQEIHDAVFQLGPLKAPGPNGFSGIFYQCYWNIVNKVIVEATTDFMSTGTLLHSINKTNLVLIPKIQAPTLPSHFRPIALCNFSYKILAKVLTNRLQPLMPDIITKEQSAFVSGRQIQDNVIVAHEIYHHLKMLRTGSDFELGIKLDMNKAYDRLEWDFLEAVLYKLGCSPQWINLVMNCVRSVNISVLVNGKSSQRFCPTRGIRQGDPLSPFHFLFVSDILSTIVKKACQTRQIIPIALTNSGPSVSHLLFADDTLFFVKASQHNCEFLSHILKAYCHASGQQINQQKSSLFFSPNTPSDLVTQLSTILDMEPVTNPGKYLGLPIVWGRSKHAALAYIRDSIATKLQGWKQATLTQAGKEILIKSVASAIPAYPMACFLFPKTLCNDINSALAKFWWGKSGERGTSQTPLSWKQEKVLRHPGFGIAFLLEGSFFKKHQSPSPADVIDKAIRSYTEFLTSTKKLMPLLKVPAPKQTHWTPPPANCYKINTDASWDQSSLRCGLAAIVRDSSGQLLDGLFVHTTAPTPVVAEALALTLVCSLFTKLPATASIIVESYSLPLIQAISSHRSLVDWQAQPLAQGLRLFAQAAPGISWIWTSRDANKAADHVASLARRRMCPATWLQQPPSSLLLILLYDGDPPPP